MNLVPIVISDTYSAYDASPIYQLDVLWAITWKRGVLSYTDLLRLLESSRSDADSQREEWHGKSLQLHGEILLQLEWEVGGAGN